MVIANKGTKKGQKNKKTKNHPLTTFGYFVGIQWPCVLIYVPGKKKEPGNEIPNFVNSVSAARDVTTWI